MSAPQPRRFAGPEHKRIRTVFRVAGPLLILLGLTLSVVGLLEFADDWDDARDAGRLQWPGMNPPPTPEVDPPWLTFLGVPILFAGISLTMWGFMGAVARYQANEVAPVAADTVNYLGHATQPGVAAVGQALRGGELACAACRQPTTPSARFCKHCGATTTARCGGCGRENAADARFCEGCGASVAPAPR